MTNPNHTDTSRSGDLVERLRDFVIAEDIDLAADRIEALEAEIKRLASFIMHCIEGEPSQSQGAVDTAIRIMTEQATTIGEQLAEVERLREVLRNIDAWGDEWAASKARAALGEKQ